MDWIYSNDEVIISDKVLGKGAFGEVRVAKWRNINVAYKSLFANNDDDLSDESLATEIEILSKLRHPNLVLFIGMCVDGVGKKAILTELMPCSLYDILEDKRIKLELSDILDISHDIANGLNYLHNHTPSIVHRDISSKNILIGGNKAKIADLGQAKIFGNQSALSRQTGMPGAMAYSAPEVLTGKYSVKIDIFSFGVLVCQMCSFEYPRIDKRDSQVEKACTNFPLLKNIINFSMNFQPNDRPSAQFLCECLESIKANDRYYPITRNILPENDIGIIAKHWMKEQLEIKSKELQISLDQTKSLLQVEETRWQTEAMKVDDLTKKLYDTEILLKESLDENNQNHNEIDELNMEVQDYHISQEILSTQVQTLNNDKVKLSKTIEKYELQLTQLSVDFENMSNKTNEFYEANQKLHQIIHELQQKEDDLIEKNNQMKLQLNMQIEYARDLETRLEQALVGWKNEKEHYSKEAVKFNKINNKCTELVEKNKILEVEIKRYDVRLRQYDDLPLPEEIKIRMQDLQFDIQQSQETIINLTKEKDDVIEANVNLEESLLDHKHQIDILNQQILTKNKDIDEFDHVKQQLNDQITEEKSKYKLLEDSIEIIKKDHDSLQTKEQDLLFQIKHLTSIIQQQNTKITKLQDVITNNNNNNNNNQEVDGEGERTMNGADLAHSISISEIANIDIGNINPNDDTMNNTTSDGDIIYDWMNTSVDAVEDNAESNRKTDGAIKYHLQKIVELQGPTGLLKTMKTLYDDTRIIWRGCRTLRELILQDESVKTICYEVKIDELLLRSLNKFSNSAVVQCHCIRLVGVLAFGNDLFRRKAGEQGMIKCIIRAMEQHSDDEAVMQHACTAITNLSHNSIENRSRFLELGGVDVLISIMSKYKESIKLQRQACWSILTLSGSDELCKAIAMSNGDSAVINAMLQHRYDAEIQQFGCWALSNMALLSEDIIRRLKKKGVIEVLKIALETHVQNSEVVRQAKHAIGAFGPQISISETMSSKSKLSNHIINMKK